MSSARLATYGLLAAAVASGWGGAANAAEKPVSGGILNFVVGSTPPSYDAHFEQTFGVVHPIGREGLEFAICPTRGRHGRLGSLDR